MKKDSTNQQIFDTEDSNRLFQHLVEDVEVLPISVYEFKEDGKCVYVNNACCKHFKRSRESLLGTRMRDVSKTFSDGKLSIEIIESLIAGNSLTFEDEHVISVGEVIPVEVTVHCFTEDNIQYAVSYFIDIRERKKIEQQRFAIKEKQARLDAESHFKRLVEAYPDPLMRTDLNGNITYAREDVASHFGHVPEKMYGHKLSDLAMSPEWKEISIKATMTAIRAGQENKAFVYEAWSNIEDERVCFEVRHIPERDKSGNAIGVLGFSRNITKKAIQDKILHFLVQSSSTADDSFFDEMVIFLKDLLGVDCVALFLLSPDKPDFEIKSASDQNFDKELSMLSTDSSLFQSAMDNDRVYYSNYNDEHFPTDSFLSEQQIKNVVCIPMLETGKNPLGFLSLFSRSKIRHLTAIENTMNLVANTIVSKIERTKFEEEQNSRAEDFRVLVESSPDFIARFDKNFNCIYVNPALVSAGFGVGDASGAAHPEFRDQIEAVLATGASSSKVYRGVTPSNKIYDVETRVVCERDKDGNVSGAIVISRDISDRVVLEEKLRKQAETDALTDLPNRRALTQQLNFALANAKRQDNHVGLLFVDLDRFKTVNDTLGHDMGDELLREAAKRLQEVIRESDMVARFGGDEFVVLLSAINNPVDIVNISESIIDVLAQPYFLNVMATYLSASIGIANFPDDARSASELIAHADQAMYIAKQQGRNTYRFFTPSMQAQADERMLLLNDLRVALQENQLHLVFQPIVHGSSGQITKAEALLRWQHPEKGFIPPDKFIPLAEDTGLIDDIGDWVFKQSVAFAKKWQQQSSEDIQVSINVSARQFNQDSITTRWLDWLQEFDVSTKHITIEVTESLLLEEQDGLYSKITQFRDAGVKFALDDFGTGYSAMSYLKKFPIDYLKIDGSFVRDMTLDNNDLAIVETISVMAARLGMKSIAECVETEQQNKLLMSFGCDYIQGYLYSKPLDEDSFFNFCFAER